MLTNIYAKNLDVINLGKHQRANNAKVGFKMKKENIIGAHSSILHIDALQESDR